MSGFGTGFGSGFAGTAAAAGGIPAAPVYTVRDGIIDALMEIGAIDPVDELESEDAETGLRVAQRQADRWAADRLTMYIAQRKSFALTPSLASNTLGDGGDFDLGTGAWRPIWIGPSTVTPFNDSVDYPLTPYPRRQDYYDEPLKTLTDLFPRRFWYEPTLAVGTLYWWPVPTTACTVNLGLPVPLSGPLSLDTVLAWPAGYQEAWMLNLAMRLCRPFRKAITPDLRMDAGLALGAIKRNNDEGPPPARGDAAVAGRLGYDIRSNRYR